jgi:hypothetical protein
VGKHLRARLCPESDDPTQTTPTKAQARRRQLRLRPDVVAVDPDLEGELGPVTAPQEWSVTENRFFQDLVESDARNGSFEHDLRAPFD